MSHRPPLLSSAAHELEARICALPLAKRDEHHELWSEYVEEEPEHLAGEVLGKYSPAAAANLVVSGNTDVHRNVDTGKYG